MKRLFRLFAAFALLTGAWACSDDKTSEVRINDGAEFLSLDYLARSVGETNMKLMEEIKKVFDPNLILNPGKVCYKL